MIDDFSPHWQLTCHSCLQNLLSLSMGLSFHVLGFCCNDLIYNNYFSHLKHGTTIVSVFRFSVASKADLLKYFGLPWGAQQKRGRQ